MSAEEFRACLDRLGTSQAGFARMLRENGDPRSIPTILRSVANWARGVTAVPGEVCVILSLLETRRDPR